VDPKSAVLLAAASFTAGAINAVAGGGTVVSFPAAIAAGLPSLIANATNTVALTPSALASAWAYRRELRAGSPELKLLAAPAALGGALGALLLLVTPERLFDESVPFLLLGAVLLLMAQNLRTQRPPPTGEAADAAAAHQLDPIAATGTRGKLRALGLVLLAGTYGGYFGAGTGIMMLAILGMLGITDMHRKNAVKTVLGTLINGTAAIGFLIAGAVEPTATAIMATGGIAGGFAGAAMARKVDQAKVRWIVVIIGAALAIITGWQRWR
jgi:hypothetical protein